LGKIVVGVDGSIHSKRALDWAHGQAKLIGAEIEAVATWEVPALWGIVPQVDMQAEASSILKAVTEEIVGSESDVKVHLRVLEGHAGPLLKECAFGADLLVVGSRGHGEFVGMLLGSVSSFLAATAPCPIVIVHDDEHSTQK
jgi:nucleotide-binding universal stress UspA family protein